MSLYQRLTRLLALFIILTPLLALPLSSKAIMQTDILEDEVDGLILRRTLTRTGHEFFNNFTSEMADTGSFKGFNIVVQEKLLPQTGSLLWVEVNGTVVYRSFLQRNKDPREEVKSALQAVNEFIFSRYMENGGQLEPKETTREDL